MDICRIFRQFDATEKTCKIEQILNGNINSSYKVITDGENNYLLQKINTQVFKNPRKIMQNIRLVIDNLNNKKIFSRNLQIVKCKNGTDYYIDSNGNFWRCYYFLENTLSYNQTDNCQLIYEVGAAFGRFQYAFYNYDISKLNVIIENFHNTPKRFTDFIESTKLAGERLNIARNQFEYLKSIQNRICVFDDLLNLEMLPLRITHNDTKCNNVLFDKEQKKSVCVVDLDTVMPGLVAYDFGDGARSIASSLSEESCDFENVQFDLNKFKCFSEGFLNECASVLTKNEIDSLYLSVFVVTAELAARFLTDYFIRDKYFKINYPNHNLDRAKNQIALLKDIDKKRLDIKQIIKNACLNKQKDAYRIK